MAAGAAARPAARRGTGRRRDAPGGVTKSQIDRLGARLRTGEVSDADVRMLDEYRQSFAGAYDSVMRRLRDEFGLSPTGRAAKSTFAILGKLRRESVRLSQIQDVAGCRVVVPDVPAQDKVVRRLTAEFELNSGTIVDRRERPSHGYRAVHLVVTIGGRAVEIQVRTTAQQLWAEMSERLSDRFGVEVKYGGGGEVVRAALDVASEAVGRLGDAETRVEQLRERTGTLVDTSSASATRALLDGSDRELEAMRDSLRLSLALLDNIVQSW